MTIEHRFSLRQIARAALVGLLATSLLLVACSAGAPGDPTPVASPRGDDIGGYLELVEALRAAGAVVQPGGQVSQPFFGPAGQVLQLKGTEVQVFEYPDEAARQADSSQITPDGQPNPTTMVTWVSRPNFWAKGRVIVLYVGVEADVVARLTQVLGEPLTRQAEGTWPEAVTRAIQQLAEQKGLAADEITVVSFEAVEWSDSCLGLGGPHEACALVITPGYRVILSAGGAQYELHTNHDGSAIRQK